MGIFDKKCSKGHANSAQASFCAQCGERLGGGEIICGVCKTQNRSDARFCKECGRPLDSSATPEIRGNHWARRADEFAIRVEASDLKGLFQRGIIVEPGTNALLVDGGATRGTLGPGTHTLDNLGNRLLDWLETGVGSQVSALLVNITPTDLEFAAGGIFTKDSIKIGVRVRLQTQVQDPGRFLVNMLGGRERLTRTELEGYLYPEISQVLEAWVAQHTVQELAEDLTLRPQLELALDEALKSVFHQSGLQFINVRATELNLEHLDHIKGIRSSYTLQIMEKEADNQGKKALFDVIRAGQLQTWIEEAAKVEDEERRVALYERMQKAILAGKMSEVRSQAEFEKFLDQVGFEKLVHEKERAELLKTWKEEAEDKDRARAHMLARLELERSYELRTIELRQRTELSESELEAELRLERMRVNKQYEIDAARQDYDIQSKRKEAEFARQQIEENIRIDKLAHDTKLSQGAADHDEEMRQLDQELDLGLKGLRGMKQVRLETEQGEWELERQKKEAEWAQQQKQLEIELQRERIRMEYELNRLDKLGQLGAEALIAASPVEQGRILADLKKAEALKDMSDDQLLALAAKDSPEVARALAEKYRSIAEGRSGEREREMYEKLLAEKETHERVTIEALDKAAVRAKETAEHAMNSIADVAKAFAAHSQGGTPIVITGQGGSQTVIPTGAAAPVSNPGGGDKTCPTCGQHIEVAAHFCPHCSHPFKGVG